MTGLLDLPPEVLREVYDWLRVIEQQAVHGRTYRRWQAAGETPPFTWQFNSNALRPYTQAYRFHHVPISSRGGLLQFATTVARTPVLGAAVRTLEVWISPAQDDEPVPGLPDALVETWRSLSQLKILVVRGFSVALDSLGRAFEQGVALAALESIVVTCARPGWANPYSLDHWGPIVQGAPRLVKLRIELDYTFDEAASVPPVASVAGLPFISNLSALDLPDALSAHQGAIANLANSFQSLTEVALEAETGAVPACIIGALSLPALRALSVSWLYLKRDVAASAVTSLDFRHLSRLEHVNLPSGDCLPRLSLLFPPATCSLVIGCDNSVPIAALARLVTPGTGSHHPNLRHIHIDLPFASDWGSEIEHLGLDDLVARKPVRAQAMGWTEAVSAQGIEDLIRVAGQVGVKLTGTLRAALRFDEAVRLTEARGMSDRENERSGGRALKGDATQ